MATSVTGVSNHFPSAENGFTTTLASTIAAGATTVPLNSVAGYANGEIAVFVVDPSDATKKQTFTGTIDTTGVQLTGVVWTAGTNQVHSGGATVVDYATATHISMMTKGILIHADQDGTLKAGAVDNAAVLAADVVTTPKILDANVTTAKIANANVTPVKWTNPYKFFGYRNTAWTTPNGSYGKVNFDAEDFDSNNNFDTTTGRYTAPVAGFYQVNLRVGGDVSSGSAMIVEIRKNGVGVASGTSFVNGAALWGCGGVASSIIRLAAGDYVEGWVYASGGPGGIGVQITFMSGFLVSET